MLLCNEERAYKSVKYSSTSASFTVFIFQMGTKDSIGNSKQQTLHIEYDCEIFDSFSVCARVCSVCACVCLCVRVCVCVCVRKKDHSRSWTIISLRLIPMYFVPNVMVELFCITITVLSTNQRCLRNLRDKRSPCMYGKQTCCESQCTPHQPFLPGVVCFTA